MSYTPPAGNALELQFGTGYTAPAGDALVLQFGGSGTPVATFSATLALTGGLEGTHSLPTVTASFDATLAISSGMQAAHGVAGSAAAALDVGGALQAAHGVAGGMSASLTMAAVVNVMHPRYELRGVVQDAGVPVDRRVRAYRRSTGVLAGEGDTVAGAFVVTVGYALDEYYLVPIDMANDAVDWAPPAANRVLSVLAVD